MGILNFYNFVFFRRDGITNNVRYHPPANIRFDPKRRFRNTDESIHIRRAQKSFVYKPDNYSLIKFIRIYLLSYIKLVNFSDRFQQKVLIRGELYVKRNGRKYVLLHLNLNKSITRHGVTRQYGHKDPHEKLIG